MKSQEESAKIYQKDANQCYQEILVSLDTLPFKNHQKGRGGGGGLTPRGVIWDRSKMYTILSVCWGVCVYYFLSSIKTLLLVWQY